MVELANPLLRAKPIPADNCQRCRRSQIAARPLFMDQMQDRMQTQTNWKLTAIIIFVRGYTAYQNSYKIRES